MISIYNTTKIEDLFGNREEDTRFHPPFYLDEDLFHVVDEYGSTFADLSWIASKIPTCAELKLMYKIVGLFNEAFKTKNIP